MTIMEYKEFHGEVQYTSDTTEVLCKGLKGYSYRYGEVYNNGHEVT